MWGDDTPRELPDAATVAIDLLVDAGLDARSWYPTEATPEDQRAPMVAVLDLGAATDGYQVATHAVQVTAWAKQRSASIRLRNAARTVLIYHRGSPLVSWVKPGSMATPVRDDVTGLWMAPCTVRIQLRAQAA